MTLSYLGRLLVATLFSLIAVTACGRDAVSHAPTPAAEADADSSLLVGAERTDLYLPLLRGKRVALLSNHTGILPDGRHTLDLLLDSGINVTTIFSPEHGFRGTADAGEHVKSSVDPLTGIPIASLYDGKSRMPAKAVMDSIDIIVTDIQDVGLRFYTYYITMLDLMNAASNYGKEFMVLDRPNPNGMSIDGPVLDMNFRSGVGRLPIPVLHGMTLGELALMINGEGWLNDSSKAPLTVIPIQGYTHTTRYELSVAPSPNLPDMKAIYLYPSLCFFEGTPVSVGRGTSKPFHIYGHPAMKGRSFSFTPESRPGAKNPPLLGKKCYGEDLSPLPDSAIIARGVDLTYLIDAYRDLGMGNKFFTRFFDLLMGNSTVRAQIEQGMTAEQIKATWAPGIEAFRNRRSPYLLYPEN
ncbi:MAG: DUF1343 domain-containing protein [Pseudoflavonifractor sp.]|nr:DUF1343 domain-containing protein [Alloprevotella sp.]MCM1117509.1 DUF1343 domain-containing protein [Pseudoflavonifractor sp.]